MSPHPPLVVIVGPTAVGKSALAHKLARTFGGAIVSADSRQIYRYMDIGTAKPSPAEQESVRHHMIDLISPDETYSAQRFRVDANRVMRRLAAANVPAFVAGGTGFYLRALLDGVMIPNVPPNHLFREELRRLVEVEGAGALHDRLREQDPSSANRIHPNNVPRLIRALEIVQGLGGPVPVPDLGIRASALYVGLTRNRDTLYALADHRVIQQIQAGLVEETRLLLAMRYSPKLPALQGFGYKQMVSYLQGEVALSEAASSYQAATRAYIRRQMTWFRADSRIQWLDAADDPITRTIELIRPWLATASWADSDYSGD